jgi:hypothetical protein
MVTDAWEPIDFLAEFRERETCLREATELLKEEAQCETAKLWAHHLPLIVDALGFFQGLLQEEIDTSESGVTTNFSPTKCSTSSTRISTN